MLSEYFFHFRTLERSCTVIEWSELNVKSAKERLTLFTLMTRF